MFDKSFAKTLSLKIRGVNTYAVEVPMTFPLGTSAAIVKKAPLLLVDLETEEGITGHSYVFCYRSSVPRAIDAVLRDAVSLVTGEQAVPWEIAARLSRRFALVGVASVVRMALSAIVPLYGMRLRSPLGCRLPRCSARRLSLSPPTIRAASV